MDLTTIWSRIRSFLQAPSFHITVTPPTNSVSFSLAPGYKREDLAIIPEFLPDTRWNPPKPPPPPPPGFGQLLEGWLPVFFRGGGWPVMARWMNCEVLGWQGGWATGSTQPGYVSRAERVGDIPVDSQLQVRNTDVVFSAVQQDLSL